MGVSDVRLVDTAGSGLPDIVVTNELTGQVSVIRTWAKGTSVHPNFIAPGPGSPRIDTAPAR